MCLWIDKFWFVAAARDECEGGNQEEEKFGLFHIAYLLFVLRSYGKGRRKRAERTEKWRARVKV